MAISLLMGNGINLVSNGGASWEHVLIALRDQGATCKEIEHLKDKPFALAYEEVLLSATSEGRPPNEQVLKKRIAELVDGLATNEFHGRVMKSGVKHVLTTNYDYGFEKASGQRVERKDLKRETKYSVFRRRAVGSTYVWHIHGESEVPNSITLGYDQYSGYLQKLRGHATADRASDSASPFKRGERGFDTLEGTVYSWLDVFLRDDIHIVGLGLDYTEIDLWWVLTYKARLKARGWQVGETVFHDWHCNSPDNRALAKQSLLRALAVEVLPRDCRAGYESAYDDFIRTHL
jgi:hypothetical protein